MVSVAIIGILSAIAFPAYKSQVQRAGRTDAQVTLSDVAQRLQRCFTANSTYKPAAVGVCTVVDAATSAAGITSTEGLYTIKLVNDATYTATAYVLTATPVSGKRQANDTKCASFNLSQASVKTAKDSGGTDNSTECWKR
jgi:type IV pilus assembly protein PilE